MGFWLVCDLWFSGSDFVLDETYINFNYIHSFDPQNVGNPPPPNHELKVKLAAYDSLYNLGYCKYVLNITKSLILA